jgi:hypothetical protein
MKKIVQILMALLFAGIAFSSCTVKDDLTNTGVGGNNGGNNGGGGNSGGGGSTNSSFQVNLSSSNPNINYRRVTVQILSVMVNTTDDVNNGWVSLITKSGMYDLMQVLNSPITIASGVVTGSAIKQIRLVFGSDNSVDIGNASHFLTIPAGTDPRVTLNQDISTASANATVNFDIDASIHLQADGNYTMTPVLTIRTF